MLIISLFQWWYFYGWAQRWRHVYSKTAQLSNSFSLGIILTTLFKPWKQITSLGQKPAGIGGFFSSLTDSLVSRFVGFWIRLFVLLAGITYIIVAFVINMIVAIVWPAIPIMPFAFIALSVVAL